MIRPTLDDSPARAHRHKKWAAVAVATVALLLGGTLTACTAHAAPEPTASAAKPKPCAADTSSSTVHFTTTATVIDLSDPKLCVAATASQVSYTLKDAAGQVVKQGIVTTKKGAAAIPFTDPGYYDVNATAASTTVDKIVFVADPVQKGASSLSPDLGVAGHIGAARNENLAPLQRDVGASLLRVDMAWSKVEKTKGKYTFPASFTKLADAAKAHGEKLLPIIDYGNPLYDGGKVPSSKEGIAAFAAYAAAVVKQFHPTAIEVMNEFNNAKVNTSSCGVSADCYLPLLKATYRAVKAASPKVTVVGGVTAQEDDEWIGRLLDLGGGKYMDAISTHPYSNEAQPETYYDAALSGTAAMVKKKVGKSIPIWVTEAGWPSGTIGGTAQADLLVRSVAIAFGVGAKKYVWYDLVEDELQPGAWAGEGSFGLYTVNSDNSFKPKPAAYAMLELTRELGAKKFTEKDDIGQSIYSYRFGSGAKSMRIMWATTDTKVTLHTTKTVTVTGALGTRSKLKPVHGKITLPLTGTPVYVDGAVASVTAG